MERRAFQEKKTAGAAEVMNADGKIAWKTADNEGNVYVGLFNTTEEETEVSLALKNIGMEGKVRVRDLWAKKDIGETTNVIASMVPAHGAVLYKLSK